MNNDDPPYLRQRIHQVTEITRGFYIRHVAQAKINIISKIIISNCFVYFIYLFYYSIKILANCL